ncbi:hypothetical protein J4573_37595 [Actinomadura barringtoniae]|uniref:Uncharacterized protein n=1 Tax=Actinomadura barringtoniae TaxID=1427535 RepID=A0A939TAU9_9ACTN|nr:hypothetical protein [Actinomadura barringtoniae]MBO2452857.1 hypothetical protein [Actinomadura barringtoniae]
MSVFTCMECQASLTAEVSRVALPVHAHQRFGHDLLPPLLPPGTYAIDPEPFGTPWRPWSQIGAAEAESRGVYAPVPVLSDGPPGTIVIAPGEVRGTVLIPERLDGYCLGLDGRDGPNLACERCGVPVATRIDDCSLWQAVRLDPRAVRRVPTAGARELSWDEVLSERPDKPLVEQPGYWSGEWTAAMGAALAHLLVASTGRPVNVPDGLIAETLRTSIDGLLPPAPAPARRLALAGPDLPEGDGDIALVPVHPQTGEAWRPRGDVMTVVPLPSDIWMRLVSDEGRTPVPATRRMPDGVHRDDAPPMHPNGPFQPDRRVFLRTLARLPEVRRPWLMKIYDGMGGFGLTLT